MDFVQRNLINERNNLQIELAKAKLLIAQLNENAHVNAVHDALDDAEKHYDPQHGPIGKSYRNDAIPHFKIARAALDAAKATGVEGEHLDKAKARYHNMMGMMPKEGHDYGPGEGGVWVPKGSYDEQTEYISSLENAVIALAESMNMSVEELMEVNSPRNMARLAAIVRQHNSGGYNSSGLKPVGGGIQPARNPGSRLAAMLGASGVHGASENMHGKVVASQRHLSGGYNQDSKEISDKTPVEFKNPDVKPDTVARAAAKVRDGSEVARIERGRITAAKAAEAERASRTF